MVLGALLGPDRRRDDADLAALGPDLENTLVAILYALTGIGAILLPFALGPGVLGTVGWAAEGRRACWLIAGLVWTLRARCSVCFGVISAG
jgi:hypothetical protein